MSEIDFIGLLPMLFIALTAVSTLLVISFYRNHALTASMGAVGSLAAFASLWVARTVAPRQVTALLMVDQYAIFFSALIIAASFVILIFSYSYLKQASVVREEYYIALLVATLGSIVMVSSTHFVSFFLGLELLTVSLYTMVAYTRSRPHALEAGMKYLILAGASSAFLLFGMAMLYGEMGTMQFSQISARLSSSMDLNHPLILTGLALMIVGIGFKMAVVPFHMWTPDVYEGAPAPASAFIATVSKGAMIALLLRFFSQAGIYHYPNAVAVFSLIAIASMFVGNLLALLQENVKRLLAYSSISHLGYMLVAFVAGNALALEAISYYLVAYFATMLGAFGIITAFSGKNGERDTLADYSGLFRRRPWIAGIFTAILLSLAGIPLTAGFIGKYLVVATGVSTSHWALVLILIVNSAIGLYYYLRIVVAMIGQTAAPQEEEDLPSVPASATLLLALLAIAILWLGVYPAPLMNLIRSVVTAYIS